MPVYRRIAAAAMLAGLAAGSAAAQTSETVPSIVLPTVEVVGTSPLPGIGIDRDKVPSNVQTMPTPDVAREGPAALVSGLDRRLGSVNLNDNEDNPYQPDLQYRGFEA